jgi:hypothetical protein
MLDNLPLIAAGEWIKLVIFAVFFIIWVVNNLRKALAQAQPPKGGRVPRPNVLPPDADLQPQERPPQQQQLAGEIEAFLKRASEKRREKKVRKPAEVKKTVASPKPAPQPAQRLMQSDADAQGFELRSTQSVADHVQQRLDTRIFGERAAHMVDDLAKQDAEREAHRKQVFDHQLGRLADTSVAAVIPSQAEAGQAATGAGSTAITPASIAALLANPENVKQAIVLNEILTRPERYW